MLKKAERLFRIVRLLRDAHPEHVDRCAKFAPFKSAASVNGRVSPIRADDEVRAHFYFVVRSFCAYSLYSLILNQQIDDFGLHVQFESWKTFGVIGEKIEKIPLRHERDEFAARRKVPEIRDGDGLTVDHAT